MPWISKGTLNDLKREVKYAKQDTELVKENFKVQQSEIKELLDCIQQISKAVPEVASLVEAKIHNYSYGEVYYELDRSGLDDLLASRDRKRQDEFAAEFDKK